MDFSLLIDALISPPQQPHLPTNPPTFALICLCPVAPPPLSSLTFPLSLPPMATLTLDLIRKKAEHHTDGLSSLQELSLHQLSLLHLTPLLSTCTPHLRILYLQNNLLPSSLFAHLRRLKSLTYLNVALNNVTALPARPVLS